LAIHISGVWHCWHCGKRGKNVNYILKRFASDRQTLEFKSEKNSFVISGDGTSDRDSNIDYKKALYDRVSFLYCKGSCKNNDIGEKLRPPDGFKLLMYKSSDPNVNSAKKYLYKRGITRDDIIFYKIGFCVSGRYKNRVVFPSFNVDGDINYFVGRKIWDELPGNKYLNSKASKNIVYNELYVDYNKPIVITEGIIDSIKCGKNSIPILGSSISKNSVLFEKIVKSKPMVLLALDRDALKKSFDIADNLISHDVDVRVVFFSGTKYNDFGEMSKEEALYYLKSNNKKYNSMMKILFR